MHAAIDGLELLKIQIQARDVEYEIALNRANSLENKLLELFYTSCRSYDVSNTQSYIKLTQEFIDAIEKVNDFAEGHIV